MIETGLSFMMWRLASHPHPYQAQGLLPLWGMDASVKLEKIRGLSYLILPLEGAKDAQKICDRLRRGFSRRNEIAHHMNWPRSWAAPDKHITLCTLRIGSGGSVDTDKTYNAKQIRQFAASLKCRMNELEELMDRHGITRLPKQIGQAAQGPERPPPHIEMTIGPAPPRQPES